MVFDPSVPDFDYDKFQRQDWYQTVHVDSPLDRPPNIPKPRCQVFIVSAYVDSDHAGDNVTRISRTFFFIYCNNALIYWMCKKQSSCEVSKYVSELPAMKQAVEYVYGPR